MKNFLIFLLILTSFGCAKKILPMYSPSENTTKVEMIILNKNSKISNIYSENSPPADDLILHIERVLKRDYSDNIRKIKRNPINPTDLKNYEKSILFPYKTFNPIYFDTNSGLTEKNKTKIKNDIQIIKKMMGKINFFLYIKSYTDERGSEKYNLKLSQTHTEDIKKYLVSHGIDEKIIYGFSYGEKYPVCVSKIVEDNKKCWASNRRSKIQIYKIK